MKRWMGLFLVLVMCLSMVSVFATPTFDDIFAAQSAGDYETMEALIRQEADLDPALKQRLTLAVGDISQGNVNKDVLGMQCEIRGAGSIFFNSGTNELSDGYRYLAEELYDIPVARWGGGSTNSVNWWNNVGPLEERKDTYNVVTGKFLGGATDMGLVEFIQSIYTINPEAKFIITLPIWAQTPEESRTFVHFLLDEKEESEYGALRASYGIEEPIELVGFELGNENYFSAKYDYTGSEEEGDAGESDELLPEEQKALEIAYAEEKATEYTDRCILHIDEVRKDFPEVAFYPNVSGGHNNRVYADPWTQTIAKNLDSRINGLAFHDYYNGVYNVAGDFSEMNHIQNTYAAAAPSGRKPNLVLTEHAIWSTGNDIYRHSHYAALTEAAWINSILWRDDIICANYHNFAGGHWTLFRRFGDKYAQDGVNYVYRLYEEKLGTQLLKTHFTTDESMVSALATRRDNGQVVLALVNGYQDREIELTFDFGQSYDLVYESIYTAPHNMSCMQTFAVSDIFKVTETEKAVKDIKTYTLPNKSVIFLTFEPANDAEILLWDDFESYDVMDSAVTISRGENTKTVIGDWALKHQADAGYFNANVSAQVMNEEFIGKRSLTITPSNCQNTDSRLVWVERQNVGNMLEGDFVIETEVYKGSVMNGNNLRFLIHNNGANYYQLNLGGNAESVTWTFQKVENNQVVKAYTGEEITRYNADPGGYLHESAWLRVQKSGNVISWDVYAKRYRLHQYYGGGSFEDEAPFEVLGKSPTFGFTGNRTSSFDASCYDNVVVYKYTPRAYAERETAVYAPREVPLVAKDAQSTDAFVQQGEPANVIYARLKGTQNGDVFALNTAAPVRKVVNLGEEKTTVYVSRDDYSYEKLCELAAGESFANTLTDKAYTYIKTEGGEVKAYTALSDLDYVVPYADMPELLARINGVDVPDAVFSVSDTRLAKMVGNVLVPIASGQVSVTANEEVSSCIYVQEMETFAEDFSSYENTDAVETPTSWAVRQNHVAGDWYLKINGSGVSNNPEAYIQDGALSLSGASISLLSGSLSYMLYDKPIPGLSNDYTISFDGNKASATSGMAVKFHMHDNGQSYYQLSFCGISDDYYVWRFDKYEMGVHIGAATILGPTFASYNTDKNGPLQAGEFHVTIHVNHGEISWTIDGKRYRNRAYTAEGTYTDPDFCALSAEDNRFGFSVNCNAGGHSRFCTFDNIRITGRTVEDVTVKETEQGNYLFINQDAFTEGTRLLQATYQGNILEKVETYQGDLWQNNSHATLFVPKEELSKTKVFIWDENQKSLRDVIEI